MRRSLRRREQRYRRSCDGKAMRDAPRKHLDMTCPVQDARVAVGTAPRLIELAAQVLEKMPAPERALQTGDPALLRYLQAARTALDWLVGQSEEDTLDSPGSSSALGQIQRIYWWTEEETVAHFRAALQGLEAER